MLVPETWWEWARAHGIDASYGAEKGWRLLDKSTLGESTTYYYEAYWRNTVVYFEAECIAGTRNEYRYYFVCPDEATATLMALGDD